LNFPHYRGDYRSNWIIPHTIRLEVHGRGSRKGAEAQSFVLRASAPLRELFPQLCDGFLAVKKPQIVHSRIEIELIDQ
jgi:hypothetical protein